MESGNHIAMEFIAGETLRARIARDRDVAKTLDLLIQIGEGLAKAHEADIGNGDAPRKVFEFDDPDARIDYPVWSPDGRWILFDRFQPQGGDVWAVE